jgi:hypothetical protein
MAAFKRKSALSQRSMGMFKTVRDSLHHGLSTPPLKQEDVPEDAMVLTVWLDHCNDLSPQLSEDYNGLADAQVIFELNVNYGSEGKQRKQSSTRLKTLNPRWYPRERYQFVITSEMRPDNVQLVCDVVDWDRMSKNEPLGSTSLRLLNILARGKGEIYDFTLPLHHPDTSQKMTSSLSLQAALQPKALAFAYHEECFFEIQRWQPLRGWGSKKPGFLLPTDPHQFFTVDGSFQTMQWDEILSFQGFSPEGHDQLTDWHVVPTDEPDGWAYATKPDSRNWEGSQTPTTFCRRRVWQRLSQNSEAIRNFSDAQVERRRCVATGGATAAEDETAEDDINARLSAIGRDLLRTSLG